MFPILIYEFYDKKIFYGLIFPRFPQLIFYSFIDFLAENIANMKYHIYYSEKYYFLPILSKFYNLLPIVYLIF